MSVSYIFSCWAMSLAPSSSHTLSFATVHTTDMKLSPSLVLLMILCISFHFLYVVFSCGGLPSSQLSILVPVLCSQLPQKEECLYSYLRHCSNICGNKDQYNYKMDLKLNYNCPSINGFVLSSDLYWYTAGWIQVSSQTSCLWGWRLQSDDNCSV